MENNEQGFHFFIINTETGTFKQSPRIFGCVNNLSVEGNKIRYKKFLFNNSKSNPGDLCCHVDEEYQIN
jgi:hypothetical protein